MRVLFCGTAQFAEPSLERLIQDPDYTVVSVVTQPDRPAGRGLHMQSSPIKNFLQINYPEIQITEPEKLKAAAADLLEFTKPEIIIVAAYGQFIPQIMLQYPKYGCLNLHGSLLPQLRGAVPVHMAILQGLQRTGVTLQLMAEKMDAGDIIAQESVDVDTDETTGSLMQKLGLMGADIMMNVLPAWIKGQIKAVPQQESQATYCYQTDIAKEKTEIKVDTPIVLAERMVRAFNPHPTAWTMVNHKNQLQLLKIYSARLASRQNNNIKEVKVIRNGKQLFLQLQDGDLELVEMQLAGKKIGSASDYLFLAE